MRDTALRAEAALHGVRVNVLCPDAVGTPILDRLPDADLPPTGSAPVTVRSYSASCDRSQSTSIASPAWR